MVANLPEKFKLKSTIVIIKKIDFIKSPINCDHEELYFLYNCIYLYNYIDIKRIINVWKILTI